MLLLSTLGQINKSIIIELWLSKWLPYCTELILELTQDCEHSEVKRLFMTKKSGD